jgi:hypothetical protein
LADNENNKRSVAVMTICRLCEIKNNGKVVLKRNERHCEETTSLHFSDVTILDNLKRDDVHIALGGREPNGETFGKTDIYIINEAEWKKLVELNEKKKTE